MKAVIELENMEFRAGHGCYDLEKKVGNRFLVSLRIEAEIGDAAVRDDLSGSINYLTVYELVRDEMARPSNILENVAKRIIDTIKKSFPQVISLSAKVSKLAPPLGGKIEKVSVTLSE